MIGNLKMRTVLTDNIQVLYTIQVLEYKHYVCCWLLSRKEACARRLLFQLTSCLRRDLGSCGLRFLDE